MIARFVTPRRLSTSWVTIAAAALLCACASMARAEVAHASAQSGAPVAPAPRFDLAAGASWLGAYDLGSREGTLTGNQVPAGPPVVLFRTTTDVGNAPAFDARFGVGVTRWLRAEAGFGYARPELRTSVSGDTEQAANVVATDAMAQYLIEGAVIGLIERLAFGAGRAVPFVTGGAGYLRQLAESSRVVETGAIYHAGAGLRWLAGIRRSGLVRGYGMRVDVRLNVSTGGVELADEMRVWPSVGAALFVAF